MKLLVSRFLKVFGKMKIVLITAIEAVGPIYSFDRSKTHMHCSLPVAGQNLNPDNACKL